MCKKSDVYFCFSEFDKKESAIMSEIIQNIFQCKDEFKDHLNYKEGEGQGLNTPCVHIQNISKSSKIEEDKKGYQLIYFYNGNLDTNRIRAIGNDIPIPLGLFCLDKFDDGKKEYSEIARFEKVIKTELRRIIDKDIKEEFITKSIDWKVNMKESFIESSDSHVSLLSDPSMRNVMLHANRIIDKIKPEAGLMFKIFNKKESEIEKLRGLSADKNNSNQFVDCLKSAFSEVVFKKNKKSKECECVKRIPTILIEGSTGTGKTLMANYIARKLLSIGKDESENIEILKQHYSKVSMANIGKETIDTELFGCIPGDFTGSTLKMGKLLANYGGVLFLDEIGEAPLQVQTKLLTYMDDMNIQIPGYSDPQPIRVPTVLVAATNRELKKGIVNGDFREDLYHRFVYKIRLPDLKERKDDFRFLLSFALQKMNAFEKSNVEKISIKAIEFIERFEFEGNFRELESRCSKAIANAEIAGRTVILKEDFEGY